MLVEINLLPQKEPKKFNILYLTAIVSVLVLIGGLYFWQIQSAKSDVTAIERQITMTKKIAAKEEDNAKKTDVATTSASLLKVAVEWANNYPIDTIPVMRHLTSLLPERGFIQSFAYSEVGTVTLSVQFDSTREAAYFLESLKGSEWIKDANLISLSIVETKETTEDAAQTTGKTTTATTNTTGQNTDSSATTNTNEQRTTSSNTTNTNTSTDSANQNNQNSTASTTSNQNTLNNVNNTGAVGNKTMTKPVKNILPRYAGQFEIKFDLEAIKKSTKKNKKDEEGVTGS